MPDRLAAARVPHERDVAHVHFVVERSAGAVVPALPVLEVLEQQPGAAVALAAQTAVDEILIDRHEDEAARGEQLAEVAVAGIRVVERVVIAVDDQHERKGPVAHRDTTRAR